MRTYIFLLLLIIALHPEVGLRAQAIGMRIPDTATFVGNNIDVPVYADNTLTGRNVLSYTLQISFNQSYLSVVSVITAGTLSAPFGSPAVNTTVPGKITIAGAGTSPLTGSGKFIFIRFHALQASYFTISFTGAQYNFFNEGNPAMSFDNGNLNISPAPTITVTPDYGIISKGEQLQFSSSGGTAPYQWFVTNSSVATINSSGLLTAVQPGFTKVVAQDNTGLRDTTNSMIEIKALRLSIPTNLSQWQGSDIDIPINTSNLGGLNIYSGNFSISFNQGILTPVSIIQTGTLLESFPIPTINLNVPGNVAIAFAGYSPLSGSGPLIYIRFHVSALTAGSTSLSFINGLFNETLIPAFTNGSFSTINLPVLSISPSVGTLVAGQTQQYTLDGGGTPPIQWSVSNPSIASISQSGLLTTQTGGNLVIKATDAHGASAASGNWLIYDTQITMPETSTCPAAGVISYPILINALPSGEAVYSLQAKVTYNSNYLTFLQVETDGTLTQGWTVVCNPTSGVVNFAGSSSNSFNTAGILLMLKFSINPTFILGSTATLQLSNVLLNQGVPNPLVDINGSIVGVNPAPASISITSNPSGAVCANTTVAFTASPVNGGTPLYQWKKNGNPISGANMVMYSSNSLNAGDIISCVLTPSGPCASGSPVTSNAITMLINPQPDPAGSIIGPEQVFAGQTGISYSVTSVPNATYYNWVLPNGWTIINGQGSNTIIVTAGSAGGTIVVTPSNSCGIGSQGSKGVTIIPENKVLNLNVMLEGLFNISTNLMNKAKNETGYQYSGEIADKITVEIRQSIAPHTLVQSFGSIDLLRDGSSVLNIPNTYSNSYYLVIKHRNSIETWSAVPVSFASNTINYSFSSSATQAYDYNLKLMGIIYAVYGGDETQDGIVDGSDMAAIDNASSIVLRGYHQEDLNGDAIVDGSDMAIIDNNSSAIVRVHKP
ncbi:MAG: Ig-like domain-containing protein [Bacteroidetes bacterium]|nr:Ig-like domain-containing protein [Bacteroidota bacterium]